MKYQSNKLAGRDHLGGLGVNWRISFKSSRKKWGYGIE